MNARTFKISLASTVAVAALAMTLGFAGLGEAEAKATMHVVKTPTCGCCSGWVDLARQAGFEVKVTDTEDYAGMKTEAGVPEAMQSCHTTTVDGYVVEGHVPFEAVDKLLAEKPDAEGIAVPGMPMGSPGMGDDPTAVYEVYAYGKGAGDRTLFYTAGNARR